MSFSIKLLFSKISSWFINWSSINWLMIFELSINFEIDVLLSSFLFNSLWSYKNLWTDISLFYLGIVMSFWDLASSNYSFDRFIYFIHNNIIIYIILHTEVFESEKTELITKIRLICLLFSNKYLDWVKMNEKVQLNDL